MYRIGWACGHKYDFTSLMEHVEAVRFFTTGYEKSLEQTLTSIDRSIEDFDPELDVLIPAGKMLPVMLATIRATHKADGSLHVAVFDRVLHTYTIHTITL